jgi:predicted secreted hydrolase
MCERAARQLGHARAQASAKPSPLWWGNWKRVASDIIRSAGILLFGPSLFAIVLRLSCQFAMVVDLKRYFNVKTSSITMGQALYLYRKKFPFRVPISPLFFLQL